MAILKEYKPLECQCCSTMIGYKSRSTGEVYCTGESGDGCPGSSLSSSSIRTTNLPAPAQVIRPCSNTESIPQ